MTAPLSQDLRKRLVRAVEEGASAREAAARFAVSASAAIKLVRRVRQTGSTAPAKIGGYRKPLLAGQEAFLQELTASRKGITLAEIRVALIERGVAPVSLMTIWSMLKRRPVTQKKQLRAAEQDRPDVAAHRRHWRVWQRYMDPERFVFLDETGAATNMVRRYGWGPRSERLVDATPHGHWCTTTFIAGLRSTGLVAPLVLDGPMTGETFLAYIGQFLAPTLSKGDVVVLDNLAAHKVAGVREAIRVTGASLLYLPPYSPDLNSIEQAFAKLKALLRKAAARSREALWTTIGQLIATFTPAECRNYLANSGYAFE
ncbi:IS630 family transposase [Roseomonas nepalensis]|uniref:IS630 family transposase n=1 Tax=Muricoccus nepalensis TaxID=1854500 RepID=A0A502EKQ7_9PROT|nr:IS630 family transposase [Roseomonas nepalensis]